MRTALDGAYWWYYGELGQRIVEIKKFDKISKDLKLVDGHEPHEFSNLPSLGSSKPQHLDIIGVDKQSNEVKFICEVKTTKNQTKKEFDSNGICQVFMKLAQKNKIPLYFAVVRLDRLVDRNIVFEDEGSISLDEEIFEREVRYFQETAKVEFYKENEFSMVDNKFVIKTI